MSTHNENIRQSFTTQGASFATQPWTSDEGRIARLVAAAHLTGSERVLDVATGPGYIAEAFARSAREVIGVDLTAAMLTIARERTQQRGLSNICFDAADVNQLPFCDAHFDVVVCRLAFHHLQTPLQVLKEMARVCRAGGTVLVEDIIASEHPERAAYQDRFETLRDPSHVHTLPLSNLILLFRDAGLELRSVATADDLFPEVERWMALPRRHPTVPLKFAVSWRKIVCTTSAASARFKMRMERLSSMNARPSLPGIGSGRSAKLYGRTDVQNKAHSFVLAHFAYCYGIPANVQSVSL